MTGPPDAVVREYQALLKMDGVDLRFSTTACARSRSTACGGAPARAACARSSRRSATT
jgi:ATP-dependent protease Clp ATPase subunit